MKPTLSQAIKAKCIDCIYDPESHHGTALKQITDCTSPDCHLYPVRPVDATEKALRKQVKLEAMTPEQLVAYNKKADQARERFAKVRKKA